MSVDESIYHMDESAPAVEGASAVESASAAGSEVVAEEAAAPAAPEREGVEFMARGLSDLLVVALAEATGRLTDIQKSQLVVLQSVRSETAAMQRPRGWDELRELFARVPEYQAKAERIRRGMREAEVLATKLEAATEKLERRATEAVGVARQRVADAVERDRVGTVASATTGVGDGDGGGGGGGGDAASGSEGGSADARRAAVGASSSSSSSSSTSSSSSSSGVEEGRSGVTALFGSLFRGK